MGLAEKYEGIDAFPRFRLEQAFGHFLEPVHVFRDARLADILVRQVRPCGNGAIAVEHARYPLRRQLLVMQDLAERVGENANAQNILSGGH